MDLCWVLRKDQCTCIMIPLSLYSAWRHWDNLSTYTWRNHSYFIRVVSYWHFGERRIHRWWSSYLGSSIQAEHGGRDSGNSGRNVNDQPFLPVPGRNTSAAFWSNLAFLILQIKSDTMLTVRAPALHVWEDYFAHLGEKRMQFNSNLGQLMYIDSFLWYRQHDKHNELCFGLSIKARSKMSQREKSALHDSLVSNK